MKKSLSMMLAVLFLLSVMQPIAADVSIAADAIAIPKGITDVLDVYFEVRESSLEGSMTVKTLTASENALGLDCLAANEQSRMTGFRAKDTSLDIREVDAGYAVVNSEITGDTAVVDVYEWSWIMYVDGDAAYANHMGFATEHRLTLRRVDGVWTLAVDLYDESEITGVSTLAEGETLTLNYDRTLLNGLFEETIYAEETSAAAAEETGGEVAGLVTLPEPNSPRIVAGYSPFLSIEYADSWVFKGRAANNSKMMPAYYNPEYAYYSSDCVNFVSQCLYAGGMGMVWGDNPASTSHWWSDTDRVSGTTPQIDNSYTFSSQPWRYTPSFRYFWTSVQGYTELDANESTVYPGNPVYSVYSDNSGGHAAICVGYNAAGATIYNSHNRDIYHMTRGYTTLSGVTQKTIQFATDSAANRPTNAHDFGTIPGGTSSIGVNFPEGSSRYFKFTVTTAGDYDIHSESYSTGTPLDTYGYLYKESFTEGGYTFYMETLMEDDDGADGRNFRISEHLEPGVYYLKVRPASLTMSGYAHVKVTAR